MRSVCEEIEKRKEIDSGVVEVLPRQLRPVSHILYQVFLIGVTEGSKTMSD